MPQFDMQFFPSEALWTLVSFALLFALLKWLVLPRLTRILQQRTQTIEREIEAAKHLREQAEQIKVDYQSKLDSASEEARRMFDAADARVRAQHRQMMDEWREEMKRREAQFRDDTEIARQQAVREIRREAAGMVVEATEHLIHEHVDHDAAKRFVDEAVSELEQGGKHRH